jgi:hypothetical protein
MRLSHVEVSVGRGTLTDEFAADLDRLIGIFGWHGTTRTVQHPVSGPSIERSYVISDGVSLVLREHDDALQPGTEDHLGFVVGPDEIQRLAAACVQLAHEDDRVELAHVVDGKPWSAEVGDRVLHTFFVRLLLPVWFQFGATEPVENDDRPRAIPGVGTRGRSNL